MSRTGASVEKFREIKDNRIVFKKMKDPRANALKIVLNSTYGAMKDTFNPLYDPRSANNVCVFGQLLLTDLIERLENCCDLIQSNTDGLIVKLRGNEDEVRAICAEWEERTGMGLGYDKITKVVQKDVNNYLAVFENGKIEAKGAYVKDLNNLDYDLAIVNEAVRNKLLHGVPVERTIRECADFRKFQKVVKLSNKYKWVEHEQGYSTAQGHDCVKGFKPHIVGQSCWGGSFEPKRGGKRIAACDGCKYYKKVDFALYTRTVKYDNKAYRVFASLDSNDGRLLKCDGVRNPAKFGNTPEHCFIENGDIRGMAIPKKLDRQYYINLANKRLEDFGI